MDLQGKKVVGMLESAHDLSENGFAAELYSPLNLAYIGDSVFDLIVRTHLLKNGPKPVDELNRQASLIVRASSQAQMYHTLEPVLTESELAVMKRGRNAKSNSHAKNATVTDYRHATGVEALVGYLYLNREFKRITELFKLLSIGI